jgi:hypothetical protein
MGEALPQLHGARQSDALKSLPSRSFSAHFGSLKACQGALCRLPRFWPCCDSQETYSLRRRRGDHLGRSAAYSAVVYPITPPRKTSDGKCSRPVTRDRLITDAMP